MRKLLLASTAVLGASMGMSAVADAQLVSNADTANNAGNITGDHTGDSFAQPGSVTVRLNGRFRFWGGVVSDPTLRKTSFAAAPNQSTTVLTPTGTLSLPLVNSNQGSNRLANYGVADYARLYPGFDGVAANGLKYGASLEIRDDNVFGAGGGLNGSVGQNGRPQNTLYLRRQWGYIGTDRFGTIRVGSADGPTTLYETGTFQNFDQGNFNGDPAYLLPGNAQLTWPFPDAGGYYNATKIVYLSPQFYGFDGGVSFEPSTASGGQVANNGCGAGINIGQLNSGGSQVASPGCDPLASTSTADYARRRNTYEALLRYRGTFGPIGLATTISYVGSGRVLNSAPIQPNLLYEDLSIGEFGLVATYGGLQAGGNAMYGHFNTFGLEGAGNNLSPKGAQQSLAWVIGTSYAVGPFIFGISYVESNTPGDTTSFTTSIAGRRQANQRREQGIDVGGTYTVAPGVSLFLVYQIDQRKQNGFNFLSNSGTSNAGLFTNAVDGCAGSGNTGANAICGGKNANVHSKIQAQVFSLGSSFAW